MCIRDRVLPIEFCANPTAWAKWMANDYRTPPLRGDKGLLIHLDKAGLLPSGLHKKTSDLYGELNGSIHGSEPKLIHRGLFEGKYLGQVFRYDSFREWCSYLSRSIEAGIQLFRANVVQWEGVLNSKTGPVRICSVCHNETDFDVSEELIGNWKRHRYSCRRCGHDSVYSSK